MRTKQSPRESAGLEGDAQAEGILYIPPRKVYGAENEGTVRVCKRVFDIIASECSLWGQWEAHLA